MTPAEKKRQRRARKNAHRRGKTKMRIRREYYENKEANN